MTLLADPRFPQLRDKARREPSSMFQSQCQPHFGEDRL